MSNRDGSPSRFTAFAALVRSPEFTKLAAMMALSFLVVLVVGILRPIRNALALDGLASGDFYQVYFVSAVVVLFVPPYNRLADRISWKHLIPSVALFFAASMVVFRFLYRPGSAAQGMFFYGWYDLMIAALIAQFFMAAQVFYNARDAKRAYPIVIAAGSVGAALGGAVTAFLSERVGTANLLLVAAGVIATFAVGIALLWARENPEEGRPRRPLGDAELSASEFKRIFADPQVRLIALTVLFTILVKQFVDYEYVTLVGEVYDNVDEVSGFLGLIDAFTQWLPIVVLLSLRPILRRWGAGVAVLIFPVAMILATGALAAAMTLPVAVIARTSERMFRYSAERTGREILYVPVPGDIKLKAKAYIDVAVEKGIGKALSGGLIGGLAVLMGGMSVIDRLRGVALFGLGLAVVLLVIFLKVRREYVASLARSIEGRFANLRASFASLTGTGTTGLIRGALASSDPLRVAFALDLVGQGDEEDVGEFADDLHRLLGHERADIRRQALGLLARAPGRISSEEVRPLLRDDDPIVRERAVRALAEASEDDAATLMSRLLDDPDPGVRAATLACLAHDVSVEEAERIAMPFYEERRSDAAGKDAAARLELATAAGLVPNAPDVVGVLRTLMSDRDGNVASAAVLSAGRVGGEAIVPDLLAALGRPGTRAAAREAIAARGEDMLEPLVAALNDRATDPRVRRNIPGALGDIPSQKTVEALVASYVLPETEQVLDDRALAALSRLRAQHPELQFPREDVLGVVDREVEAGARDERAAAAAAELEDSESARLLRKSLAEANRKRREGLFRWLGLVYPQHGMYRSYLTLEDGSERARANALEWLESTVGHTLYTRLGPLIGSENGTGERPAADGDVLRRLWDDEDVWLARCALWAAYDANPDGFAERLDGYDPGDPGLGRAVRNLRDRLPGAAATESEDEGERMDLIEKVFLLQNVDLLQDAGSQQLGLLASIAREVEVDADRVLLRKGEPTDALYIVIRGEVALEGVGDQSLVVSEGSPFGTWALIDTSPSLVEARTVTPARLLEIRSSDFQDLLVDHPELGLDLLQGLARRVRTLVPS